MRLGLVGWASDTGVGMELRDALRYLPVESVFYLDHPGKPVSRGFTGKTVGPGNLTKKMETFLDSTRIDTILSWETPGSWEFPVLWKRCGIRWFSVIHWDWFAPKQIAAWKTARLIVPFESAKVGLRMIYDLDSTVLQVPVDLERIPFRQRQRGEKFVTVYGHGGPSDRRAIKEIIEAWRIMGQEAPPLEVLAQKPIKELEGLPIPESVSIRVGNLPQVSDLYERADIAVLPSKYEGVGLSLIEAQAAGLPVITTDMDPMRRIAPSHMVVGETGSLEIMEGHKIATCTPYPISISGMVKSFLHKEISEPSRLARQRMQDLYSWSSLKNDWINFLEKA